MKQGKNLNTDFHGLAQKRNRTTSSVLLVLFAVSLFLFSSCPESFSPEKITLPEGKGSFSLSLSPARTILPNAPVLDDFVNYELAFTAVTGGENETVNRTNATLASDPVLLYAGTYNLTVTAYKAGNLIAARGTAANIVINPGQNTTASVMLHALIDEPNTEGTFKWNITLDTSPVTVTLATMKIFNTGGTQQGAVVNLTPSGLTSSERTLASGMYTVSFDLEGTEEGEIKTVKWDELLYVYATLESVFTHSFTDEHFKKINWKVTFNENYEGGGSVTQSVLHGGNLASNTPVRSGYNFLGWYTSTALSTLYNFNSAVLNDFTLYAKWEVAGPVTRTIVVDMYDSYGDGWNTTSALRILINGIQRYTNVKVQTIANDNTPTGQRYRNTLTFDAEINDLVEFYWVAGSDQGEISFIVYYEDTPPVPLFYDGPFSGTSTVGPTNWNGENALLFRNRNSTLTGGALMGSFTVESDNDARPPKINTQPSNVFYYFYGAAPQPTLSVVAASLDGGTLSYQWYRNTANSTTGGTAVGTNSSTYSPDVSTLGAVFYYCVITNTNPAAPGNTTATRTTNVVRVRVSDTAAPVIVNADGFEDLTSAFDFIGTTAGNYEILVEEDQTLAARTLGTGIIISIASMTPTFPIEVQLTGTGSSMFTVNTGASLTLTDVVLKGLTTNTVSLVRVNGGTFTMLTGSEITGNRSSGTFDSGVSAGAIGILSGTFNLNGGKIHSNTANDGGGVSMNNGTINFTSGEISNNQASSSGGGIYMRGGTLTMSGGLIADNTSNSNQEGGGGVWMHSGAATATFNMTGGIIRGNRATNAVGRGGGVLVWSGNFTKTGNSIIYGNNEGTNSNTAANATTPGHAVRVNNPGRTRNTTAGAGVDLNSGATENWE